MTNKVKYPRTPHFSWSLGASSDDKVIETLDAFKSAQTIVVTEKMDGENTTIYADGSCHARSLDSKNHESRSYVKSLAAILKGTFPDSYRICGENLYARHSIAYNDLEDHFLVFAIYDGDVLLPWNEIKTFCDTNGLSHVPEIYIGRSDPFVVDAAFDQYCARVKRDVEGYVVRVEGRIRATDFSTHVAKWVRANHVQTSEHWMHQKVIKNGLGE